MNNYSLFNSIGLLLVCALERNRDMHNCQSRCLHRIRLVIIFEWCVCFNASIGHAKSMLMSVVYPTRAFAGNGIKAIGCRPPRYLPGSLQSCREISTACLNETACPYLPNLTRKLKNNTVVANLDRATEGCQRDGVQYVIAYIW